MGSKSLHLLSNAEWWMVVGHDVRTAPIIWLLFAVIGVGAYLLSHRLHPIFAIEKSVVANSDVMEPMGKGARFGAGNAAAAA